MKDTTVLAFGKFRGTPIAETPDWYLRWMSKTFDDDCWRNAAAQEIKTRNRLARKPKKKRRKKRSSKSGNAAITYGVTSATHKPFTDPNGVVHMIPKDVTPSPDEECPFDVEELDAEYLVIVAK